jgi:hypothetical protein
VLAATACTVLTLTVLFSVIAASGARGPIAALRSTVATAPAGSVSEVLSAPPATDVAAQEAAVNKIIVRTFGAAPIVVRTARLEATGGRQAAITWTIAPDAAKLEPANLDDLATGFAKVQQRVESSTASRSPAAQLSGAGAATTESLKQARDAADAIFPIPVGVVGLAGIVALVLCGRLLAATRDNETRLLRARGARVADLVAIDTLEALVVAVPAAIIGGVVSQLALAAWFGPPTSAVELRAPAVAAIVLATVVGWVNAWTAAHAASGAPRPAAGRATSAVSISAAILVVAIAAIAAWRFLTFGSPLPGNAPDVSAEIAPAALLCAVTVIGLLFFGPLIAWLERLGSGSAGLARVLPRRQVHRNPALYSGVVALVILSLATTTLASAYSASWTGYLADATRMTTGSDLRASLSVSDLDSDADSLLQPQRYASISGVDAVAPVLRDADNIDTENITTIGIAASKIVSVAGPDSSVLDASTLATLLKPGSDALPGIRIPDGSTRLEASVTATAEGTPSDIEGSTTGATVWIVDPIGDLAPLALGIAPVQVAGAAPSELSANLPAGGPWTIVAIDSDVVATSQLNHFEFRIGSFRAVKHGGSVALPVPSGRGWRVQSAVFGDGESKSALAGTIGFSRSRLGDADARISVRLMPTGSATVPIVVSRALANADDLRVGARINITGQWASYSARVVGIVPLVPGVQSGASVIADLPSLENGWLRTSEQLPALREYWVATSSPLATGARISASAKPRPSIRSSTVGIERAFIDNAVRGLWTGAIGSAVFALLALAAAVAVLLRRRRGEVWVLRAVGVSPREQARLRRAELVTASLYAGVAGVVAGAIVSVLTVAILARSSTPSAPRDLTVIVRFDLVPVAIAVIALAAAFSVVVWRYGVSVMSAAKAAKP